MGCFDVCDREIKLDAIERPKSLKFLSLEWRIEEEIWRKAVELNTKNEFIFICVIISSGIE